MTADPRYRPLSVGRVWAIHGAAALVVAATAAAALLAHVPGLFAVPGAVIAVELGMWIWLSRRAGRLVQRMGDTAILVEQGAYARVAPLLDALADDARLIPNLHALVVQRRADVHFACGELDAAEALALAVVDSGWMSRPGSALYVAYPKLCALLAVIAALGDRPEIVATWEARSRRAITDARKGTLAFMDAILAARAHRYGEVSNLELAAAPRPYGAVLRWVIAYATAETPSARDRLASRTEAARASTAETLALAPYWPKLAAFVAGSGMEAAS